MFRTSDEQETEPNLEEGTLHTSLLKKEEEKPFSYYDYFKKHYFLGGSIVVSLLSVGLYEYYVEQFDEKGLQQTAKILPTLLQFLPTIDLSSVSAKPWVTTLSWFLALNNGYMDFSFFRPKDFIDGYNKICKDGFFSGIWQQLKNAFTRENFLKVVPNTLAMLGAFTTLSYASVMTFDTPDDEGGNSPWMKSFISLFFYGSFVNYLLAQGPDTFNGLKFYLQSTSETDAQQTLWHYFFRRSGMKSTVIQTEIIRSLQNIMRGISGGFYVKSFLEYRGIESDSYLMQTIPPIFGLFTALQSHIGRGPGIYEKRIGKEGMRFDLVTEEQIQEKYEDYYENKWKRFRKLLHPVAFAQATLFGYASGRLSSLIYESPALQWLSGGAAASVLFKIFYHASMRQDLARRVIEEENNPGTTIIELSDKKDFAHFWALGVIVLSYTARTINGVPSTMSFCKYLRFLNDQDKIVMAYSIGILVSYSGFEYYLPKVKASTQELFQFIKNKCGLARNKSTLFAHPLYQDGPSINTTSSTYLPPPLPEL